MLHTKFRGNRPDGSGEEDFNTQNKTFNIHHQNHNSLLWGYGGYGKMEKK